MPSNRCLNFFNFPHWITCLLFFSLHISVPLGVYALDNHTAQANGGIELTLIAASAGQGETLAINYGDDVSYSYVINNTGTSHLNINSIQDDSYGDILSLGNLTHGDENNDLILNPNEIWTYTFKASTITLDVNNIATVTANPVNEFGADLIGLPNVTASAAASVKVYQPAISVIKTAGNVADGGTLEIYNGDDVSYTYRVSNIGDTDLGSISLMDNPHGSIMIAGELFSGVFESGDIDGDKILDTDELWTYSLTVSSVRTNLTTIGIVNGNPVFSDGTDIPGLGNPTDSDMSIVAVIQPGMVSGSVLEDVDGDDLGDQGIENVSLALIDASGETQVTSSDDNGFYTFDRVVPGPFTIIQEQPIGYRSVSDTQGQNDNFINGVMMAGDYISGNDFIEMKQPAQIQTISGYVYADTSGDKKGNIGIPNVLLTVTDASEVEQEAYTDDTGYYSFEIAPGKFTVVETDPDGYSSMADAQGKNNNKIKGEIEVNEQLDELDFIDAQNAIVSGKVMQDMDFDAEADIPMADTEMIVIDQEDERHYITTQANGTFEVSIMPGPFTIIEIDPIGYRSIKDIDDINDNIIKGTTLPGQRIEGQDFLDALRVVACEFGPPTVTVTDNVCAPIQAGSVVLTTDCEDGTTAEYSIDNGITWSTTLPLYDPNTNLTILSRCVEDEAQCLLEFFDFESLAPSTDPVTDINNAGLNANGITLVSLAVVNNGSATQDDFEISDDHLAGAFGPKLGVENGDGLANNQTATFTFSGPMADFCIILNDLDQNDAAVINGSLGGGAPIALTAADYSFPFGMGACPAFTNNNTFESQCFGGVGNVGNSLQGAVEVCFPSPIDQLEILFYDWNGTGGGSYTITTFEICVPQEICISDTLTTMTSPIACCVQPAAPVLAVTDNVCNPLTDGMFTVVTDCPAETTLEYSIDNGLNWTLTMPTYPNTGNEVIARCVDSSLDGCISENSAPVVSNEVTCGSCIEIVKSSFLSLGPDGVANVGDSIIYNYRINNCGDVLLQNVTVEESMALFSGFGNLPIPTTFVTPLNLNPGDVGFAFAPYVLTQEDINAGTVTNQAIAIGQDPSGNDVTDISDSGNPVDDQGTQEDPTVTPIDRDPSLTIIKSSELDLGADGIANEGDIINYTYIVTNTGNVSLSNVTVTELDALFSGSGQLPTPSALSPSNNLDPGDMATATATYTITQEDINTGGVTNQAVATGQDPAGNDVVDDSDSGNPADDTGGNDDPTQTPINSDPCIEIIKSSSYDLGADGVASVGDIINYTYEVINCGNVRLAAVAVTELQNLFSGAGTLPIPSPVDPPNLNPGESGFATASYIVIQEDINNGGVTNQAVANGIDPTGATITDDSDSGNPLDQSLTGADDPTETPILVEPCINIIKGSSLDLGADNLASPGDIITYNYTITNCGNVTLNNVAVTESVALFSGTGDLPIPSTPTQVTLAPDGIATSSATYAITQEDINNGGVTNQAVATGTNPAGDTVTDNSDSDNPADETGGGDDPTVTPIDNDPCIELIKSSVLDLGDDNMASVGDMITYSYEFVNCGNVTLENISIVELQNLFTGSNTLPIPTNLNPTTLGPGLTGSGTASYSISQFDIDQGSVSNQAIVIGQDPNGEDVSDNSDSGNPADETGSPEDPTVTLLPSNPCIEIIKSSTIDLGSDGIANPGDQILYSYEIMNCGNVTLSDIAVIEANAGFSGFGELPQVSPVNPPSLASGDTGFATAIYIMTQEDIDQGSVTNSAVATANDPGGNPITDDSDSGNPLGDTGEDDDPTVTIIPQMPCIELIKSSVLDQGIESRSNPGDQIVYQYEVINCGNVTLTTVEVTEIASQFTGTNGLPTIVNQPNLTLVPGDLEVFNAIYSISQMDIDAGGVTNQALASGTTGSGTDVTDNSDSGNPLDETGDPDDPTVTPIPAFACVELEKSSSFELGDDFLSSPGDVVTYTYVVRNCGQLTLTNLDITESLTTFTGTGNLPTPSAVTPVTIGPGEEGTAIAFYAITQADITASVITNQAVVTADPPYGESVSDDSDSGNPFDNLGTPDDLTTTPIGNCLALACNSNVQVSLSECTLLVTADMILENPFSNGAYHIELYNNSGEFLRNDTLFASDVGETINYKVLCGGNSCWGTVELESNVIPEIPAPCACDETGKIPDACQYWCGTGIPDAIVTPEEALQIYGDCGPRIVGNISVKENKIGDLCSEGGEVVELVYTIKIERHGEIEEIELLCQRYSIEKLDIDLSEAEFNSNFGFPRNVTLDCDYLNGIDTDEELALGSPESIYAATGSGSLAFSFYIDQHQLVDLIRIDTIIEHVEVDTMHRKDFIQQDVDGDGMPEWILVTIVDKVYEEKMVFDTVVLGMTHPEIPIIEQVCNLQTAYSDIEFELCGGGLKIVRDWTVIDWCDSSIQRQGTQNIYIKDSHAPVVTNEDGMPITTLDDIVSLIDPWLCSSNVKLPELMVEDDCTTAIDVEWLTDYHVIEDGFVLNVTPADSPLLIEGIVTDDCGNESNVSFTAIVKDDVAPVVVCEERAQVVLITLPDSNEAVAKALAQHFDAGSNDLSCGNITLTVVREEDWSEQVLNCQGERVGFKPVSCDPQTTALEFDTKECGEETIQVTQPGEYAKFCCADIGQELYVILIVTDDSGNRNTCRVPVQVINKTAPIMVCEDQVVDCTEGDQLELPNMLAANCQSDNYVIELLNETATTAACSGGTIIREWYVDLDGSGSFNQGDSYCKQRLLVSGGTVFDPYTIKWPKSYDGAVQVGVKLHCEDNGISEERAAIDMGEPLICNPSNTQFMPSWCESACNLVGYSMDEETLSVDDACNKIVRTWAVIDWCTYDVNQQEDNVGDRLEAVDASHGRECETCTNEDRPYDDVYFRYQEVDLDGYYTYEQIIYIADDTAPILDVLQSATVETVDGDPDKEEPTPCEGEITVSATASDFCGGNMTSVSQLEWTIRVLLDGVEQAEKIANGANADMRVTGEAGETRLVDWLVKDACGNVTRDTTQIVFTDNVAPTPICLFGATTSYGVTDGMVEVWAKDMDFGSYDNCTSLTDLRFTIVPDEQPPLRPGDDGFEEQSRIMFSCEEFTSFAELNMWVWDADGNGSFCDATLLIGNNGSVCGQVDTMVIDTMVMDTMVVDTMVIDSMSVDTSFASNFIIAGDVYTEAGLVINDVEVTISTGLSEYPKSWTAFDEGHYAFNENPEGYNYSLVANKEDDATNGVSTLDLVLISQQIIGESGFMSPYQIIAADANGDGRLSAVDLVELKRLILGVSEGLDKTGAWSFIKADQEFIDDTNPWPFTKAIAISDLQAHHLTEDFIGIKIGDVNASAQLDEFSTVETRSSGQIELSINNTDLQAGETRRIDIRSKDFNDVYGMQFTLAHAGLELIDVSAGTLDVSVDAFGVGQGESTFSWFESEAVSSHADDVLFTIEVKAELDVRLSESMAIISGFTKAEAYVSSYLDIHDVAIEFEGEDGGFEVYQNAPNPFSDFTIIPLQVAQSGIVFVSIYNSEGRLVWSTEREYTKGSHQLQIDAKDIDSEGLLFYTISDGTRRITKQMVHIK